MKGIAALLIVAGLLSLGCLKTGDCGSDGSCLMNAIGSGCQNASGHTTINSQEWGNSRTDLTVSKDNGTCLLRFIGASNGQQTDSVNLSFKSPAVACAGGNPIKPTIIESGYQTTDGKCYRIGTLMGTFTLVRLEQR